MKLTQAKIAQISIAGALGLTLVPSAPVHAAISAPAGSMIAPARASSLPASAPFADSAFEMVWTRNDQPVASKAIARSWTWGPAPMSAGMEPYAEAPDGSGQRLVQYFDKARMEINNPRLSPTDKYFVTNGLLTVELISGQMQLGNSKFENRKPAVIDLASDSDDATAPTYASFGTVSNTSAGPKPQPDKSKGGVATGRIDRAGAVVDDPSKAQLPQTKIAYFEKLTNHNVPRVFWDFLNSTTSVRAGISNANKPLLDPWVVAMGLPISDAYWARVKIAGQQQDVLIQAFERRVLTYAPGLAEGWQVQMGNIGQHYFQWRYGGNAASLPQQPGAAASMPAQLTVPALGVSARIEQVGVDKDNNMDIPKNPDNAGWFKLGTVPGNMGNSVIDGHLNWYGIPQEIFYNLGMLKAGDRIYVRDDRGRDRAFVVTKQLVCQYNNCPLMDVYGPTNGVRLNLITCAGIFNRTQQNYDKRLVVFSEAAH
ncbi:MAG: class F sortase [Chloroflexota bacterium]|nr:class F sortase [Chloroflexota bacterium]